MVKIITQNVRGLNNEQKRKGIFSYLREKADIICLQEVHSEPNEFKIKTWETEWGGKCYWSHGTSASKGTAILVKKDCNIEINDSFTDSDGRIVGIQYHDQGQPFILVNIYAPNSDEPDFFINVFKLLEKCQGKRIIVGDYNLVLDEKLDRTDGSVEKHTKSLEILKSYIEDTMLTDVWRDRNDEDRIYTFIRKMKGKAKMIGSRLDFYLIDSSLSAWVKNLKYMQDTKVIIALL